MAILTRSVTEFLSFVESLVGTNGTTLPYYGSLDDADNYFQYKLYNDPWLVASRERKIAALVESTRAMDNLNYIGNKTGVLEFPRDLDAYPDVPVAIKQACYENALALLDGVDTDTETDNLDNTSRAFGGIRTTMDRRSLSPHRVHGIASATAWRLLRPFLCDGASLVLSRVS